MSWGACAAQAKKVFRVGLCGMGAMRWADNSNKGDWLKMAVGINMV